MNKKIPVVFLTDNNYAIPTGVAIQSMIQNFSKQHVYKDNLSKEKFTQVMEPKDIFLDIYIIVKDVSEKNLACFSKYAKKGIDIHFVYAQDIALNHFEEDGYYVSSTALLKFSIARLLPQSDKVLYIDGDVLIQKDLKELYEMKIGNYLAAAVPDLAAIDSCHFDDYLHIRNYFNSGVLLLNTKAIREEKLEEKLYETKRLHPEYHCMDQDVFNDVFRERVLFLPPKFNLMSNNFQIANYTLERVNEFYHTDYLSFEEMQQDAVIIHLTNERKPWKYKDANKAKEWYLYYQKTPFYQAGVAVPYEKEVDENIYPVIKKGLFVKHRVGDVTTLFFAGVPLLRKVRSGNVVYLKVCGCRLIKKILDGYTHRYYFMGILIKKLYDPNYFLHRLFVYKDTICMAMDRFGSFTAGYFTDGKLGSAKEQSDLYRQFLRLEDLKTNKRAEITNRGKV